MTKLHSHRRALVPGALLLALACSAGVVGAATVEVRVTGLGASPAGSVGCWLFASPTGFPLESAGARVQWHAPDPSGAVVCRFPDVAPGTHAVSVGHDLNGNKRVDVDVLGRPNEPWGVSNNVRPSLRAPRFEEASFKVPDGSAAVVVEIKAAR